MGGEGGTRGDQDDERDAEATPNPVVGRTICQPVVTGGSSRDPAAVLQPAVSTCGEPRGTRNFAIVSIDDFFSSIVSAAR